MLRKTFEQLPKDEREDFLAALYKFRQVPDDYVVTAIESDPPPTGGPIDIEITVRRKTTNAVVTFNAGNLSNWVLDFEHALRAKAFG